MAATQTKLEKSDETIELELAVMTVLRGNPNIPTYEAFREAFANHLTASSFAIRMPWVAWAVRPINPIANRKHGGIFIFTNGILPNCPWL